MEPERTTTGHAQVFDIDGRMVQRINDLENTKWRTKRVVSLGPISLNLNFHIKGILNGSSLSSVDKRSKRPPQRVQKRRNDIYVNRKTDFAVQLERCQKALDSRYVHWLLMNRLESETTAFQSVWALFDSKKYLSFSVIKRLPSMA